jgi:hypothetical protein
MAEKEGCKLEDIHVDGELALCDKIYADRGIK